MSLLLLFAGASASPATPLEPRYLDVVIVPGEDRTMVVPGEDRHMVVPQESRRVVTEGS